MHVATTRRQIALHRPGRVAGMLVLAMCVAWSGCEKGPPAGKDVGKRVMILGCDGMDPKLVRRLMEEGRLPNFVKLASEGGFKPLTTSIPPQSPVAWSNFITGADPGVHGIFDFIHRDLNPDEPGANIAPYFSTSTDLSGAPPKYFEWGQYRFDLNQLIPWADAPRTELARRGTPFWDYLDARDIAVHMYRLPANYPPSESKEGNMACLAGMGTPDVLATQGTYQHFTTRPRREKRVGGGMLFRFRRDWEEMDAYIAEIHGPPNDFKQPRRGESHPPELTKEIAVYVDPDRPVAKLRYVNESPLGDETVELVLNEGDWSGWQEIHFSMTPIGPGLRAMARFYLQQVRPELELYVSPLNFIPTASEARISEPESLVADIGEEIGPFYTQGFAEDFKARDDVFTDAEYKVQADIVLDEGFDVLDYALDHFEQGVLFFYFSSSDLQAHIFWWDSDAAHPVRSPEAARTYHQAIEGVYERMDEALGRCMERLGGDTTYIVMSDHGFCNFRRGFSLNTWLRDEGYLFAERGVLEDADWSKTRAYGLGLNGLYLNLKGRERLGIVDPIDRDRLLQALTDKLLAVRDPETGERMIRRVYRTDAWYHGPEASNAPDLIVGYERGYRASWNTCLGSFDKSFVVNNRKPWSADHCIAHDVVPGILITNRPITLDEPALYDVAPTVLGEFDIETPETMRGQSFFKPAEKDHKTPAVHQVQ